MLKRTEYGGKCLLQSVQNVLDYMEAINETKVKIGTTQRQEEKYFDPDAFKEAWLNAVVHNRWIENIPPLVCIFDDHIEIDSNGGLPAALSKEDFYEGISKPVNEKLLNIFKDLGFIEQTGHGVPLIISKYSKEAFYIGSHTVRVKIPINKNLLENNIENSKMLYLDLNNNEIEVLNLIRDNSKITTRDMIATTNLSKSYVEKIINNLKTKGYIERVGADKNGYWNVLK